MAKLGDLAASTTTTIPVTYLPQFIIIPDMAATPTSIQVSVLGEATIMNLNAAGAVACNWLNAKGQIADGYMYQLANGLLVGKNVEITITNADAAIQPVYGFSPDGKGNAFAFYEKNTLLEGQSSDLTDFAALAFAAPTASDIFTITMADGTTDKISVEEIEFYNMYFQNFNPVASGLIINNTLQSFKKVNVIASSDRVVFRISYKPA